MDWVDHWLAGLVHRSGRSDLTERFRHERFIVSRTVSTLAALAAIPPYLLGRGAPDGLGDPEPCGFPGASRGGRPGVPHRPPRRSASDRLGGAHALRRGRRCKLREAPRPWRSSRSPSCRSRRCSREAAARLAAAALLGLLGIPLRADLRGERPRRRGGDGPRHGFRGRLRRGSGPRGRAGGLRSSPQGPAPSGAPLRRSAGECGPPGDRRSRHLARLQRFRREGERRRGQTARNGARSHLQGRGFFGRIHVADRPAYLKAISDAATRDGTCRGAIPAAGRRRSRPAPPP